MSLHYIIDGYNIINNPLLINSNKTDDLRARLLEFIRVNRLCGSPKNRLTIVFDGYPAPSGASYNEETRVIFSGKISADDKIKRLVEESADRKNIVVVSDDKEIKFIVKSLGARSMGTEEFISTKEKASVKQEKDLIKPELAYSQIHKINEELRKIWLK
jgi:predicted RNA-binding protein with PIN domain